ncbi:4a-hydroxytetrahydrobiopterin dehydratase [Nocardia otitidiscaviarum]|uniref:Putative pterin-4-alpha-carbinolamine dehydratase n=1 Tax=Nocardia otitidiscaviarum TaxID=1823 RepID=A0A378Y7F4_9NOCA|nr:MULTISPECIES: 4a-hydroxytetrahydrobiopterin dehydratase [Nocardia]MBF6131756.1 4a-hydroxytetrahydrobiopterin dehydratase [Nocardia otitidiscaviarum]MBF6178178.1 4a-hydroxytetrahydrobiopterin dehydratase [Nocardia otitidiscaviarum]MBF6238414.1 4a-hydroxytetrahydrobiopterin dehydratase [Nocardia otitidiscaviarum]MBF6482887.1 4a-hydroxytetrahydrobiopterin dehydratase [Nocardia otitidiscaviarum]MCP9623186.1 4a-hydroxytetrahydrobiopterin dehydratase [Nocardia otitidiscaviarum]
MSTELLSDDDIAKALTDLPGWTHTGASIARTVEAPSFLAGIELVRRVAQAAEAANHHPDIDIRWRRVTFTLSTHSAGGLTQLDVALAHEIDRLTLQS